MDQKQLNEQFIKHTIKMLDENKFDDYGYTQHVITFLKQVYNYDYK